MSGDLHQRWGQLGGRWLEGRGWEHCREQPKGWGMLWRRSRAEPGTRRNTHGAVAGVSPRTLATLLGTTSPCLIVFPLGTWHFQLLRRCIFAWVGGCTVPLCSPGSRGGAEGLALQCCPSAPPQNQLQPFTPFLSPALGDKTLLDPPDCFCPSSSSGLTPPCEN